MERDMTAGIPGKIILNFTRGCREIDSSKQGQI